MRDSLKVASWEIRKMLHNKSFLLSILLTPVIMVVFSALPTLLAKFETDRNFRLYVIDELGVYESLVANIAQMNIVLEKYTGSIDDLRQNLMGKNTQGYLVLNEEVLRTRTATIMLGGDGLPSFDGFRQVLEMVLRQKALEMHGVSQDIMVAALTGFGIKTASLTQKGDMLHKVVPAVFGGLIIMAVFITGIMTMQSAIVEKKDRMAEILLSSVSPDSLMQGKLLGYFVLGLIQVMSWLTFAIVAAYYFMKIPVLKYLVTPSLPLVLFFALGGYLLYSAILVAIGATIEDMTTATNFQSIVFMIPMIPVFFIPPVMVNPNGIIARIGTYFPFATPGVMLLRIALSTTLGFLDILLPALILMASVWLMMKLAAKIFRTGILMYGKNATPAEIWRWVRQ